MAALWTLLYFVVTQVVAGIVFTVLIFGIAMAPELREHGIDALKPDKLNAWMQAPTGAAATLLVVACTQFTGLVLSWLLLRGMAGRWWKHRIALTRGPTATHMALVLIGLPALLAVAAAVELPIKEYVPSLKEFLDRIGIPLPELEGTDEMLGKLIGQSPWALALFVVGVTPAICEEVFCRGFLAWGLAHRYRTWAVVLIVSFLFGLMHGDPRQGLGAMLLGAAIHGSYLATRSLWVPMFVHWANNSLAVVHYHPKLFPVLEPYERLLQGPTASAVLFVVAGAAYFAAVGYALYQTRCKLVSVDPDRPTWRPPSRSGMELPPPGSGTVVTHDRLSPLSVALVLVGSVAFGLVLAFA
jgi:membrane protease YdiL (CAAX protease family)